MRKFLFPCIALLAFCADASGKTEVIIPDGYSKVVFQDEFDTDGMPDNGKWGYEQGYVRNGELQYYAAARKENTYIKNGNLHIVARNDSAAIDGEMRPVSSASLTTQGKHSWRYCHVEVRAKLPSCLGSWPAIWMMPEKSVYGDWPKSGEIDIMEHVGYAPENVHYAAHSEKYNHVKGVQKNRAVPCANVDGEYHIRSRLGIVAVRPEFLPDSQLRFRRRMGRATGG